MKTQIPAQLARLNAKLDAQIAAKNAAFKKATPAQKRVMIAKDVLERMSTGQAKPTRGVWAKFPSIDRVAEKLNPFWNAVASQDVYDAFKETSLQDKLVKERVPCVCCALGGLMTSCVAIKNELTVNQFIENGLEGDDAINGDDLVGLSDFFDSEQLKLIEFAFEKGNGYVSSDNEVYLEDEGQEEAACAFIKRYPKVKDRYRAIFQNIVRNKGTFAP